MTDYDGYKIFLNNGYPSIYIPEHELADQTGRVFIHRLVMSEHLGRKLNSNEIVHHKDGNKWNWKIDNLELTNRVEHGKHHHENETTPRYCKYCYELFTPKQNRIKFCSPKCSQLANRRFTVTKEVLKKLVWVMPTTKVAKSFGVSDKAVEKRCKLFGINKPPRGYWAKQK
jgi:hypothetical protein